MPGGGGATVLDDLPESIVVEEILIRLPPKDLLRCRAVRKCWHTATSTDKFMLEHHRHQPLLPIVSQVFLNVVDVKEALVFVSRGAGAGQHKLCPVLRSSPCGQFHAALDGLLIVSEGYEYFICNPVTCRCAPLWRPGDISYHIAAFFRHQPSGEYRVLWVTTMYCPAIENHTAYFYVVAVGSSDNPRCIRQAALPDRTESSPSLEGVLPNGLPRSSSDPPVHHNGSLYWKLGMCCIIVFNTTTEMFRIMPSPAELRGQELLLEMDGALAFCSISSKRDTIDVWVMQDYDAEIWSFKHWINLSVVDPPSRFDPLTTMPKMAVRNEGELLIQFYYCRPVLRYDIDGEFLGYVKSEEDRKINLEITSHYLQESVMRLPLLFHETRGEDEPPFFIGCNA